MGIGKRITELRNERGLTQKDLADKLNVTPQAVSRWENENVEPGLYTLKDMATIFEVSIDELMDPNYEKPEIKQETKQVEEKVIEKQDDKLLGICGHCGRAIYSGENSYKGKKIERHGRVRKKHDCILCEECHQIDEAKKEERRKREAKERKKRFVKSMVWGIIVGVAVAVILIIEGIAQESNGYIFFILSPIIGFVSFETLFTIIMDNTFVSELFLSIVDYGFVQFPGIIFSLDIGGILFFIFVKLLFGIIGLIVMFFVVLFALAITMLLSTFMFFIAFSRRKVVGSLN